MKRLYKCLKAFPAAGWEVGKNYELDEADAAEFVESKRLELVPVDETEQLIARVVKQVHAEDTAAQATLATEVVKQVLASLGVAKGGKVTGPGIQVEEDGNDKTKSFAEFLHCIGMVETAKVHSEREAAHTKLLQVYNAAPDPTFPERFALTKGVKGSAAYKAALAESSGTTGGYTTPPEYSNKIFSLSGENTLLVGETDDYNLQSREIVFPILDQTTAPVAGQTAFYGGVVATWGAEAALRQETEPKFKELRLVANELSGYALASNNILQDNVIALEQYLTRLFGKALGWFRDYAYLQGDGTGKPQGILNANSALSVTRGTSNQINYVDIATMYGKLLPESIPTAFWAMQQSAITSFLQMKDASNRLIVQPYWPGADGGPATARPKFMMLGIPIKTTEKLPALGTKGDLMLIDPKKYATGTRQDLEIAMSPHVKFLNNQSAFRFIFRGDGKSWLDAAVTLQDATTQVSPFVVLN
jgi:HK97 family phage major capsid protein